MRPSSRRLVATFTAMSAIATFAMSPVVTGDDEPRPTTARGQTPPIYGQSEVSAMSVDTSWGTLRGELRRPLHFSGLPLEDTPVILQVSPYGVLNESLSLYDDINADATADYFVARGYAYGIFDAIGTHASDGCTAYGGLPERESTAELVDAIGSLAWTNGNVGMIGGSYDGTLAIAAAIEAPEHLKAIIPQVAIDRWYDYMYDDGVRMAGEDSQGRGGALPADPPADSPLDYDLVYGVVPDHTQDPSDIVGATAEHTQPCNRVENQTRGYEQDPLYDQFWIDRDYRALAGNVTAAVLFEGAWLDDNVKHEAGPSFIGALPDDTPKHLVMGQWTHSTSKFSDAMNLRHAWFDQYLYGIDTGVDHLPTYDTQADDGERRQSDSWPPTTGDEMTFELTGSTSYSWADVDKTLSEERMAAGVPCSSACATTTVTFGSVGMPNDGSPAIRLVGTPTLDMTVTSSTTHLVATVIMTPEFGNAEVIARGFLDTRNRNGLDRNEPHDVETFDVSMELWPIDVVLPDVVTFTIVLSSVNATFGVPDVTAATVTVDDAVLRIPGTSSDVGLVTELYTHDDPRANQ